MEDRIGAAGREERPLCFDFTEQVVLVTGAGAGIGRATARRFAQAGASVVALDQDGEAATRVAAELQSPGIALEANIQDWTQVQSRVTHMAQQFGRLDVVANIAGIYPPGPVADVGEADWDLVVDVNLKGAFAVAQAAVAAMRPRRSGVIVLVASADAWRPTPDFAPYAAAKMGVISIVRSLALHAAPHGVRVNGVAPGPVGTETARAGGWIEEAARRTPLGRVATPEEIADAIVFLASPFASFITGETLSINGGGHMR